MIRRSQLSRYLRVLAKEIRMRGDSWQSDVCDMAAKEIELLEGIIVNDPVEIAMEEGDRANG